jgi:hypothetical protein
LCCRTCYRERADDVAAIRRVNDKLKAAARRAKGVKEFNALIAEYAEILRRDPCAYCGGQMQVLDHIEPLSGVGPHAWDNLTPACGSCNARKSAKPLLGFLAERCLVTES